MQRTTPTSLPAPTTKHWSSRNWNRPPLGVSESGIVTVTPAPPTHERMWHNDHSTHRGGALGHHHVRRLQVAALAWSHRNLRVAGFHGFSDPQRAEPLVRSVVADRR